MKNCDCIAWEIGSHDASKIVRDAFKLDGVKVPSVNRITDSLSKDGLYQWYRKVGFFNADGIANAAKAVGSSAATAMENYRKFGLMPDSPYERKVVEEWVAWHDTKEEVMYPEVHLVNTKDKYHGFADVVIHSGDVAMLGDDKIKKRHANLNLILNEHAYAMCDSMEVDGEIVPVPWKVPIESTWLWTFHPETGQLFPEEVSFDFNMYNRFLLCKSMYYLNKEAEAYFKEHATLLPHPEEANEEK